MNSDFYSPDELKEYLRCICHQWLSGNAGDWRQAQLINIELRSENIPDVMKWMQQYLESIGADNTLVIPQTRAFPNSEIVEYRRFVRRHMMFSNVVFLMKNKPESWRGLRFGKCASNRERDKPPEIVLCDSCPVPPRECFDGGLIIRLNNVDSGCIIAPYVPLTYTAPFMNITP